MADVEVTITDQSRALTQKGFGVPLVLDITKNIVYSEIKTTADAITAGLVVGDLSYKMIAAILAQSPHPEKIALYGYDVDQEGGGGAKTIDTVLNELVIEHDDWYFLLLGSRTTADIHTAGDWAVANGKFGVFQPAYTESVANIVTLSGTTLNLAKAAIYAHNGGTVIADPYLDAGVVGRMAPLVAVSPGKATWKFKTVEGVGVATYTNAEVTSLHTAHANTYIKKQGILQTSEGLTTSGTYIDIEISKDWLVARMVEEVSSLLYNSDKVPYDVSGVGQVVEKVKSVLKKASLATVGVIARDAQGNGQWSVTPPVFSDILASDKSNRILPDIYWEATIAGAVHSVKISGVLKV